MVSGCAKVLCDKITVISPFMLYRDPHAKKKMTLVWELCLCTQSQTHHHAPNEKADREALHDQCGFDRNRTQIKIDLNVSNLMQVFNCFLISWMRSQKGKIE